MAPAKKSAAKKSAAKKSVGKKAAAKKPAVKKSAAKKPTVKKPATRKSAARKSPSTKAAGRKYGPRASEDVREELHEMHLGRLTIGKSDKKVTNPKQAIAIGLARARREGAKVPPNPNTGR